MDGPVSDALRSGCRAQSGADSAYSLYEKFRPKIPDGARGWGASGTLDLELIRSLARRPTSG